MKHFKNDTSSHYLIETYGPIHMLYVNHDQYFWKHHDNKSFEKFNMFPKIFIMLKNNNDNSRIYLVSKKIHHVLRVAHWTIGFNNISKLNMKYCNFYEKQNVFYPIFYKNLLKFKNIFYMYFTVFHSINYSWQ